jgi:hypothetical protein
MLKEVLIGRKYLADEKRIRETGFPHEVEAFYATRKPNWKVALLGAWYAVAAVAMIAMIAVLFAGVCACTDYNWCPIH